MRFARRSAASDGAGATPAGSPGEAGPDAYEVLGLDDGATDAEVRQAWSSQVTSLDPSRDGARLVALNGAAETLLDGDRRASLDASRAAERQAEEAARASRTSVGAAEGTAPVESVTRQGRTPRVLGTALGLVLLVALSVVATVAVVAAVVLGERAQDATALEDAWQVAPATAERAAEAILGYDYREIDADGRAARQWLTQRYSQEYDTQFAALKDLAVEGRIVVAADVYASGVLSASAEEASVLMYVDQTRSVDGTVESPVANRVRFDMVVRDGRWLVDDVVTLDRL